MSWLEELRRRLEVLRFLVKRRGRAQRPRTTRLALEQLEDRITPSGVNHAPVLAALADQTMTTHSPLMIVLNALDADGDPLTYSAKAQGLAYGLQQQWGLFRLGDDDASPLYHTNYRGAGEKYLQGAGGQWFYLLPDGRLFHWGPRLTDRTLVARPGVSFYDDPSLLTAAQPDAAAPFAVQATGGLLTLTPTPGLSGSFLVTAAVSDGIASAQRTFIVNVANHAPVLAALADQTMTVQQGSLTLPLQATDPDLDPLTYTAQVEGTAAAATLTAVGGQLTIAPANGFNGRFAIDVAVSDGVLAAQRTFSVLVTDLTADQFTQQVAQIDAGNPMPASGYTLDWTKYSGDSWGPNAEGAVFDVAAWYSGKPGVDALSLPTLPQNGADALPELRTRVSTRLAALDAEIADLASSFGELQNTSGGVATYGTLREDLVEQATLQFLDQDLGSLQAARDEEAGQVQGARDLALHSLIPVPATPASPTIAEQLAAVRSQEDVVIANLGALAVGLTTEQDIAAAARYQATTLAATTAAQEVQTVSDTARTALTALQAQEAQLQDMLVHPLDHTLWSPVSGVDFAVGMLPGSFRSLAPSSDESTLITTEGTEVALRDPRTGHARYTDDLGGLSTLVAAAPTADGKFWTLTFDNTVALRDASTYQVLWQWQDNDHKFIAMTATKDGSLVAVVRGDRTITLLRRNGNDITRSDVSFTDTIQADLHFDPSGAFLAVPMQNTLVLLNVATGVTHQFTGFRDWVNATAWSGDGTMVAAGDRLGFVQVIDVPTMQEIGSFQVPSNATVSAVAFSPNQALVVTGDSRVGLMFWDITHLDQIKEYARSSGQQNLAYFQESLTGNTLLARSASGIIAYAMPDAGRGAPIHRDAPPILDPVPPTPPPGPDNPAWQQSDKVAGTLGTLTTNPFTSVSPDGQSFVIPNGGAVQLETIATGQVTQTYSFGGDIRFAALGSDGRNLIVVANNPVNGTSALTAWDLTTGYGSIIQTFPSKWMGTAFNAAHNLAAVADHTGGGRVQIIDFVNGTSGQIAGTENHSAALAISDSGRYVAVGLNDGTVLLYDRTTQQSHTLTGLHLEITALAWSHGTDALLAAADNNANLALFSPAASQPLSVFSSSYDSDATTSLQFSSNNLLLFRGAKANGLLTFDVSNAGSPRMSSELPLLALNGASPLALSVSGATLFVAVPGSAGSGFITGVTVPAYGRTPSSSGGTLPPPALPPALPLLNSAQQNELAAPTTIATLNATQQQYLLDSVTAYFTERVKEGGTAGVPSLYLQSKESQPGYLGLSASSSYRDFYGKLVADMQAKWPLQNAPQLDALAGGSGNYVPPVNPVTPPDPSPVQVAQQQTVEQLVLQTLRSPVRLSAGQWVNVIDPHSTTHVGAHANAVDLNLIGAANDANPYFDKGQPIYAPMDGTVIGPPNRLAGQLVIEHHLTQADGTPVTVTTVYYHLKIDDSVIEGMHVAQGAQIGQIWDLTDGTIQSDGETTIDSHLHFEVHLGRATDPSLDLTSWLQQEKIGTMIREDGVDTGGEGVGRVETMLGWFNPSGYLPTFSVLPQTIMGKVFLGLLQKLTGFAAELQAGTVNLSASPNFRAYLNAAKDAEALTGIGWYKILEKVDVRKQFTTERAGRDAISEKLKALFSDAGFAHIFPDSGESGSAFTGRYEGKKDDLGNVLSYQLAAYRDFSVNGVPADASIPLRFDVPLQKDGTTYHHVNVYLYDASGEKVSDVALNVTEIKDQLYTNIPLRALTGFVQNRAEWGGPLPDGSKYFGARFFLRLAIYPTAGSDTHQIVDTPVFRVGTTGRSLPIAATPETARKYVEGFDGIDAPAQQKILESLSFTDLSGKPKTQAAVDALIQKFLGKDAPDTHRMIWDSDHTKWVGAMAYDDIVRNEKGEMLDQNGRVTTDPQLAARNEFLGQCKYWLQQDALPSNVSIGANEPSVATFTDAYILGKGWKLNDPRVEKQSDGSYRIRLPDNQDGTPNYVMEEFSWKASTDVSIVLQGASTRDHGTLGTRLEQLQMDGNLLTGDMLQYTYGEGNLHTLMIGAVTETGVWAFDCNFVQSLTTGYHFMKYSDLTSQSKFTLYRIQG